MSSDRRPTPAGSPDTSSGAVRPIRPDGRRENEGRTKDAEPGGAAADDVVCAPWASQGRG